MKDRAKDYLKYRLWAAQQFPDPELVFEYGGMFALVSYLKQCGSPEITAQVLRRFGAKIHPDAFPIGPWITVHEAVSDFSNLEVGAHAHVGKEVFLDLSDRVVIGESVALGMRAVVLTHLNLGDGYPNKPTTKLFPSRKKPTVLGRGCSVGAGSIVLCGVTVGEDAVINAGVVVDRDVPARTVVTSSRVKGDFVIPEGMMAKARRKG